MINPNLLLTSSELGDFDIDLTLYPPTDDPGIYILSSLRVHFLNGAGKSSLLLSLNSRINAIYNVDLIQIDDVGFEGFDLNFSIMEHEFKDWSFWQYMAPRTDNRDGLTLFWGDPEPSGTPTEWSLTVAWIRANDLEN